MARVKTFVNGGSLLPSDLNSIEDDYEYTFSGYKEIQDTDYRFDAATAGTYVLVKSGTGSGVAATGATAGLACHYFDPARYTANTRTTYFMLRATTLVNATAPACNFTVGFYPVTAPAGAAATVSVTLGTVTTGSTAVITAPAGGSITTASSGDFTAPAAGLYAFGVVLSAGMAANSSVVVRARLEMRQV